jgi:hypothetical protein
VTSTTIGSSTTPVTLTAADKRVTLTGTIDAYGTAGTYSYAGTLTGLDAAVFGPKTTDFTVINAGTVIGGTAATDFGIVLGAAGTLDNKALIESGSGIFFGAKKSSLDNTGTIIATAGIGADFAAGGKVDNTGLISGISEGIYATGKTALDLTNSGTILGLGTHGVALEFAAGNVTNAATGLISGSVYGIIAADPQVKGAASVTNAGTISGAAFGAVIEAAGGLTNKAGALVIGSLGYGAILADGAGGSNAGTISGGLTGLVLEGADSFTNAKTGIILGQSIAGALVFDGAVLYNSGSIAASATASIGAYVGNADIFNYKTGRISGTVAVAVDGGYVYNAGKLTGVYAGSEITGSLVNTGTITGDIGVTLAAGGTIGASLTNSGVIQGSTTGLSADGFVLNTGLIEGTVNGAYLDAGATLRNAGTISGGATGNGLLADGAVTAVNEKAGLITGTIGADVFFGATLTNDGTILSTGPLGAFIYDASASNDGLITGGAIGADVLFATLDNAGTINNGVLVEYGTLTDTGFITANAAYAIDFVGTENRLIIAPAATIHGNVSLAGAALEIAAAAKKITTINPTQYLDIGALTIDAGASLDIAGAFTASTFAIVNDGVIDQTKTLDIEGSLSGTGTIDLAAKAPLTLGGTITGQTIAFTGTGETLDLAATSSFAGALAAFTLGDTIDLAGATSGTLAGFTAGVLTILETQGSAASTLTLTFASSIGKDEFVLTDLAGSGLALTLVKPVKAAIATPAATVSPTASPTALPDLAAAPTPALSGSAANLTGLTMTAAAGWILATHPTTTPPLPAVTLHA